MIYLVSKNQSLFKSEKYKIMSLQDSIKTLESWDIIQYDSETSCRDPHIGDLLCVQFGNKESTTQIVVDCTTIDIKKYKDILESKRLVGHNLKFDLQFLYNHNIIPRKVYDTMIIEQLLYLGWPRGKVSYSLKSVAERRLGIDIDKTVRGEIIWRGLDEKVIMYAAGDVMYLCNILRKQIIDCRKKDLSKAARIECDFIPSLAYLEWCGIHLDTKKWEEKMQQDKENLANAKKLLDNFVISNPAYSKYTYIDRQGSLFDGFDLEPKCIINWSSSQQVVQFAKELGFDTQIKDKSTGEDKDSVLEKHLKGQKGINDEFLKLYFNYQEYNKVVTSFGQGHLNAVNPNTDRIHTIYRQLGAASGRMSCGSQQPNTDLAKLKNISAKDCTYPNMQQLPGDERTRSCFTAPRGYKWCSCDYSA